MKRKRCRLEWDEWLSLAAEYYLVYGNLLVERDYIANGGYRLGRWVEHQRAMYNGIIPSSLDSYRIHALEAIGMVWKVEYHNPWECWMEQVQLYYAEHGDLLVPKSYKNGIYCLGNWILDQRKKYAKGLLTEKQIADLEGYGMSWSECERRSWDDWYRDAMAYYAEKGDLMVPVGYINENGKMLGQWIAVQRERNNGKCNRTSITPKQKAQLDKLDMVWNLQEVRDNAWERMYVCICDYVEQNGRLPLWPRTLKTEDGRNMPNWINIQRTRLSKNRCPKEQAEKLSLLGIYPWKYN